MCSPAARRTILLCSAGLLATALCVAAPGCARPEGQVFEPLAKPMVWPAPPEEPRIRLVGAISGSGDLKAAQSGMEVFKEMIRGRRGEIAMTSPHSIAVAPGPKLGVTDVGQAAVHIIDLERRTHVLVSGVEDELFETPIGVCWAGNRLFVTDAGRQEVFELDASGGFHNRFGATELKRPVGIAYVATRDQLYVVDGGAHDIAVFGLDGGLVRRMGGHGTEPGEFNYPSHICWDGGDRIAVADSANFRVQILDLDGQCITVFGTKGDAAGNFALPKGVAFDSDHHVYVVDSQFENVQIFTQEGQLLLAFGREGSGLGRFALPAGLAIDKQDEIWVADSANHRIQVFDYLRDAG